MKPLLYHAPLLFVGPAAAFVATQVTQKQSKPATTSLNSAVANGYSNGISMNPFMAFFRGPSLSTKIQNGALAKGPDDTYTESQDQAAKENSSLDDGSASSWTMVNQNNGYVTTDWRTGVTSLAARVVPTIAKGYGDSANGSYEASSAAVAAAEREAEIMEDYPLEEDRSLWDDGDVAVNSLHEILAQVKALSLENKALKLEVRILEECNEESQYEQVRLEREVELLQGQMTQCQNQYRTLAQEQERLQGELYLLLLEREATQVEYTQKLSVDTRLEQAELRLIQKGVYS